MAERPKRTNANTHPGRILLDINRSVVLPQKRLPWTRGGLREKQTLHALRKEDRAYPNSTPELDEDNTSGLAIVADPSDNLGERADARDGEDAPMLDTEKLQVNAAENEDGDEDESRDDDDKDDEEGDENEDEDKEDGETSSDSDIKERKSKKKGKQATKKKGKEAS
ncbi:hypothetical protein EDB84DRAFT_1484004 [Lactarius hengduanensis]|nr:hypothetical protein EDB84DRAFT_1484004 [Lactarius hengduanensis]